MAAPPGAEVLWATPGVTGLGPREVLTAPVRASVTRLRRALDEVLAEAERDPAALAEVAELAVAQTRLHAALLDRVADVSASGAWALTAAPSLRVWLASQTRQSLDAAGEDVRLARSLTTKPATRAALLTGDIRIEHARHATRGMDRLAAELPGRRPATIIDPAGHASWAPPQVILDDLEAALLAAARLLDPVALGVELRKKTAALAPVPASREVEDHAARRRFSLRKDYDGSYSGQFRVGPEDGAMMDAARQAFRRTDHTEGDTRTPTQRDADALVAIFRNSLEQQLVPAQHQVRPHLLITVPYDTWLATHYTHGSATSPEAGQVLDALRGTGTGPGGPAAASVLGTGEPVLAAALARISCDARITRIVLDPTGRPLDVGRTQRIVPPQVFLAAAVRDGSCAQINCHAPPERCEAHHVRPFAEGGHTRAVDIRLLCKGQHGHHHQVHDLGRTLQLKEHRWIGPHGWTTAPDGHSLR